MRLLPVLTVLTVACGPATAVIDETGGTPIGDDTGAADTGDTEGDTDDTEGDTEPQGPDFSEWQGERTFVFEVGVQCTETVDEDGVNVTADPAWSEALAACEGCDELYWIEVDPGEICAEETLGPDGFSVSSPVLRGLEFGDDGHVIVYSVYESEWSGWQADALANGLLLGGDLEYGYAGQSWGVPYDAEGLVSF